MMPSSNTFVGVPFSQWTDKQAGAAIASAIAERVGKAAFEANRAYLEEHDHWQTGDGWVGPRSSEEAVWKQQMPAIERQFTPAGVIAECLDRVANSLLKQEPDVAFAALEPAEEGSDAETEQLRIAEEMVALISAWWDEKKLWQLARQAVRRSRWAARGPLRAWMPAGHLVTRETAEGTQALLPSGLQFSDALSRIELSAPEPGAAYLYEDPITRQHCGIYHFQEGAGDDAKQMYELWFVEGEQTIMRIVGGSAETDAEEYRVDLGGRIPIVEMEAELLVTEVVRRQQKRLDFVESLLTRVAETGGFPERYTTNAEPAGVWLRTPPTNGPALMERHENGETWYLHPAPRTLGAAITTDLRGIPGEDGKLSTPGVHFKDPTDPAFAIKSSEHARRAILQQCKQAHVLMNSDAAASGYSREQARADFEDDLTNTKGPLEGMIRDLIEVVIAWAGQMSNDYRDFLDNYRCVVNLHVNSGPISPEEQRQNNENVKAGTLSQESAMALNGVEDVEAELQRIGASPESMLDLRTRQSELILAYVAEGMSWEDAALEAGVEPDGERMKRFKAFDRLKAAEGAQGRAQEDEIDAILAGTGTGGGE